jgi:hypothetical protein
MFDLAKCVNGEAVETRSGKAYRFGSFFAQAEVSSCVIGWIDGVVYGHTIEGLWDPKQKNSEWDLLMVEIKEKPKYRAILIGKSYDTAEEAAAADPKKDWEGAVVQVVEDSAIYADPVPIEVDPLPDNTVDPKPDPLPVDPAPEEEVK